MNDTTITQHPNSILNPDVVHDWARECTKEECLDRAFRGEALLPAVAVRFKNELPRAELAVMLWKEASE